jgi:hypothetical protein
MKITQTIEVLFKRFLPSPFAIAIILTVITILLALFFTEAPKEGNLFFYNSFFLGKWNLEQ